MLKAHAFTRDCLWFDGCNGFEFCSWVSPLKAGKKNGPGLLTASKLVFPELENAALVRELHVYGKLISTG